MDVVELEKKTMELRFKECHKTLKQSGSQFPCGSLDSLSPRIEKSGCVKISDEYAYRIPNPKHMPKYTQAKVLYTPDKYT